MGEGRVLLRRVQNPESPQLRDFFRESRDELRSLDPLVGATPSQSPRMKYASATYVIRM